MTVYRICSSKYPKNDGEGARLYGGRWNHEGTALIYCGATASLCALEVLAHADKLPRKMIVIEAEIPDALPVKTLADADIPDHWKDAIAPDATKELGTKWAADKSTLILSVPSCLVPAERNYLINPAHPDFGKIKFSKPKRFVFDPRLK